MLQSYYPIIFIYIYTYLFINLFIHLFIHSFIYLFIIIIIINMYHLYPNSRRISRYPIRPPSPCRRRHGASDNFRGDSCDGSIVAKHRSPAQLCAAWEAGPRGLFRHGDHGEAVKTAWRNVQKLEKVMLNHLEYNEFNPISRGYLQIHSFVMGVGGRWVQKSWTISMEQRKITPKKCINKLQQLRWSFLAPLNWRCKEETGKEDPSENGSRLRTSPPGTL